jgi:hypothetical protein
MNSRIYVLGAQPKMYVSQQLGRFLLKKRLRLVRVVRDMYARHVGRRHLQWLLQIQYRVAARLLKSTLGARHISLCDGVLLCRFPKTLQ